ncbi:MAG: hypothetical protein KAK00_00235 [Nanoarchaeota archaeon]|nr:hypothetical protein [Nanoarchaeota archaeon]
MRKKAQITIFVILGLVIVFSAVLFLTIKGSIERKEIAPGISMIVEELPSEFLPVQPFIEKCIEKTAKEGLIILGQRGGYIYTDKLNPGASATDGDSIRFSAQSDMIIPYWFYLASDNECIGECEFKSKKLPLKKSAMTDSVEDQLSRYIEENIGECFDGFKSMKELSFVVEEKASLKAKTIIAENDIVVTLDYPLAVSRQNSKIELSDFYINIDLNLKKIYTMAGYITELEKDYRFLERLTQNLIVGFSGKDPRKLPPMSDASFEINNRIRWSKSQVRNNVRSMISSYIPMLRQVGTLNWQELQTESIYMDKLYNYGMSIPNNVSINDVSVGFDYLDFWDLYFDLNCNGEVCEPESAFTDLLPIGLQRYNFAYDISYPVLVGIEDPSAFNNQGYTFNFMLESNMRNNKAMPAIFEPLPSVEDSRSTLLCNENKRTSGKVNIQILDSLTDEKLDNVEIIYDCIESCYIGDTKEGALETQLPVCFGGTLSFRKQGYEAAYLPYDSYLEKQDSLEISLNPKKEFKLSIKKKEISKQDNEWLFNNAELDLDDCEIAMIIFSKEEADKETIFEMIELKKDSGQNVKLPQGTYELELNLICEDEYYIPADKRDYEGEEIEIDELKVSSIVTGRTLLNYTLTKEDLNKETLTLFVLSADIYSIPVEARKIEDLDIISDLDSYSKQHYFKLLPRLE